MAPYASQPFGVLSEGTAINTGPLGFASRINLGKDDKMMMAFAPRYTFKGMPGEDGIVPGFKSEFLEMLDMPARARSSTSDHWMT